MNTPNDTIVAPATAVGGAIAVVRMSGSSALAICDTVFSGARRAGEAAGYTVLYGTIADGARVLDDVLVTVFRAPHSYTGEDAVEISCHGSRYIVRELLALLVRRGARMGSRAAHTLATDQMRGGYSAELETLRGELLRLASLLELELDFGEEEVEFADRTELRAAMERIGAKIDRLIDTFALGNAIKEGVAVAIVGRPNVGKSTLLNRLLNEERALVSETSTAFSTGLSIRRVCARPTTWSSAWASNVLTPVSPTRKSSCKCSMPPTPPSSPSTSGLTNAAS